MVNLKLYGLVAYTVFLVIGTWTIHNWYDGNKETKVAIAQEKHTENNETKLIQYQEKVRTVYVKSKDNCLNAVMPDSVRSLLVNGD